MDRRGAERLVKEALSLGKKVLVEPDAKEVLKAHSIAVPEFRFVKDVSSAIEAAQTLGYPIVLKLVSPDILHKSEVHGVAVGIKDIDELQHMWAQMVLTVACEKPFAQIEGFLVEGMAAKGIEVIAGVVNDEQFGPTVMFGLGGISVEIMRDVSYRIAPITKADAIDMIREIKGYPLLAGFRGDHPKDIDAIADVIVKLADIAADMHGIKELEINPLIVYEKGAIAVDARAILGF
ncbi:MAG: acetate--CoA ligase family protein [Deltaproteobacteria bacterium]